MSVNLVSKHLGIKDPMRNIYADVVELIFKYIPEGSYKKGGSKGRLIIGENLFVNVIELLSRIPKTKIALVTNYLYFQSNTSEYRKLGLGINWHVNDHGQLVYFTMKLPMVNQTKAYVEWRASRR